MPTFRPLPRFLQDYRRLTEAQGEAFRIARARFVQDLRSGRFRAGLRIKAVQKEPGDWEMTWAPDGRATFHYGEPIRAGEPHIIWRRIGAHDILDAP